MPWYGDSMTQDDQNVTYSETYLQMVDYKRRLSSGSGQIKPFKQMRKWLLSSRQPTEKSVQLDSYSSSYFSELKENKLLTYVDSPDCNAIKVTIKLSPKPIVTVQHQQAISYENMLGR